MPYKVEKTKQNKFALVAPDGVLVHPFDSEFAAQTAADSFNRANYEPPVSPYDIAAGPCETPVRRGRWDQRRVA